MSAPQRAEILPEPQVPTPDSYLPPTTRHDASATYARYVPASKSKLKLTPQSGAPISVEIFATSPPPQKRKRDAAPAPDEPSSSKKARIGKEEKADASSKSPSPRVASGGNKLKKSTKEKGKSAGDFAGEPARQLNGNAESHGADIDAPQSTEAKKKKKKRKHDSEDETALNRGAPSAEHDGEDAMELIEGQNNPIPKEKKAKSKKKQDFPTEFPKVTDEGETGSKKHERLMKKRQKSLKKAEALGQVEDSSAEDAPPEEIPEVHDLVPLPQPEPVPELPPLSASEALPPWMASPIRTSPTSTAAFKDLGIGKQVSKALGKAGYKEAFAVQAAVLPLLLPSYESGDILVSAATGSGKTLAYVLPMIQRLSRFSTTKLRAVIVMPTRELVMQAKTVADICSAAFHVEHKRVLIGTAVGNETLKSEQSKLTNQISVYDPERSQVLLERENRKWNESDSDSEFRNLFDEEVISSLPNHVTGFISSIDVLICTPGRLVEHLKSTRGFTLKDVSMLVVDEADKLLDQSFQQWVDVILTALGTRKPRQEVTKIILSATMTRDIGQLSQLKLHRPRFIELEGTGHDEAGDHRTHVLPKNLLESGVKIEDAGIKPLYLLEVLKRQNLVSRDSSSAARSDLSDEDSGSDSGSDTSSAASTAQDVPEPSSNMPRGVLIFTKSNESAVRLGRLIALLAPSSAPQIGTLTSTLPRTSREHTIRSFSTGAISILVASDLVSRGLDLPNLAHVVNYDVPSSLNSYIHRVGRTARAGKAGHAWTLFTEIDARWFWNEIARAESVKRESKVGRVNITKEFFGEDERTKYQDALDELGNEASVARVGKE